MAENMLSHGTVCYGGMYELYLQIVIVETIN